LESKRSSADSRGLLIVKVKTDIEPIFKKYAEVLNREIDVEKIILVGSYTNGDATEWSDIEFAVISKDFNRMPYIERLRVLSDATLGVNHWLVPFGGNTPDEYEHPEKTLHMRWIKSTGKVVYPGS
jgi:hypothetical protein